MNNDRESYWREVQLDQRQWANVPESAGLWAGVPPDEVADTRLRINEEMRLILHMLVFAALTKRQRQVLELYFFEGLTQEEIASALGITQPTVSQHLFGKQRGPRLVGGALEKLRKAIRKAARRHRALGKSAAQVISVMDARLDQALARLRHIRLAPKVACSRRHHRGRRNNKKKRF